MSFLGDKPRILTKMLLGTSLLMAASVACLSGFFLFRHKAAFEDQVRLRAESLAGSLAGQMQFALLMNNRADLARVARQALDGDGDVIYAVVEDAAGNHVASAARPYVHGGIPRAATALVRERTVLPVSGKGDGWTGIEASVPVIPQAEGGVFGLQGLAPEALGRVRVALSLKSQDTMFQSTLRQVCGIALVILLAACGLGFVQIRGVLLPLVELARVAKRVGRGDYDIGQAVQGSDDEVGELVESFHEMVGQVADRTRELSEQVAAKELARAELAATQQQLIDVSRRSGMAEIATSVLHNVGNVLNSVNVSATLVAGRIRESKVSKLTALTGILCAHSDDLSGFVRDDPKGQRVLPYLGNLCRHLEQDRENLLVELDQLTSHIGHIKQIVATQQNYARVSGVVERIELHELVEDAIRILESGFVRHHIELRRDFEEAPALSSDKHQILQILLNLLRNAKQSIDGAGKPERLIRVRIRNHGSDRVRLEVRDSGLGLSPENLTRIFAHGFTTKADGHGFGLHSGALAAQQLGGSLWAESEGLGLGATFTLELPFTRAGSADREEMYETVNTN